MCSERSPAADGDDGACRAVLDAVARAEGTPAEALDPLYDAVDPDALAAVFGDGDDPIRRVVFEYHGYTVTARAGGRVSIEPLEEA